MHSQKVLAIDVGGSTLKSGLVNPNGSVGPVELTPVDSAAPAEEILDLFASLIEKHGHKTVGFGFPGPFDYAKGVCLMEGVAKYGELFKVDIGAALVNRLGPTQLHFRNDAEAAIVGEALYGSVQAHKRVLGLSLGTGCGSAFLLNGVPQTTGPGVPANGWVYPLSYEGERADDLFSIRGLRSRLRGVGFDGSIPEAATAACQGNLDVLEVWMGFGSDLGRFLTPLVRDFQADAVLVLGGIAGAGDLFTPHMQIDVPLLLGQLGRKAALLGAAQPLFEENL